MKKLCLGMMILCLLLSGCNSSNNSKESIEPNENDEIIEESNCIEGEEVEVIIDGVDENEDVDLNDRVDEMDEEHSDNQDEIPEKETIKVVENQKQEIEEENTSLISQIPEKQGEKKEEVTPKPSPSPTPTPTPMPEPTSVPIQTPSPTPSPTPEVVKTPEPTPTAVCPAGHYPDLECSARIDKGTFAKLFSVAEYGSVDAAFAACDADGIATNEYNGQSVASYGCSQQTRNDYGVWGFGIYYMNDNGDIIY